MGRSLRMLRQRSASTIILLLILNSMIFLTLFNVNSPQNQASLINDLENLPFNPRGEGSDPILVWNTTWGTPYLDYARGVAVDATGAIYCAGYTNWYGGVTTNIKLVKFNANGMKMWNTTWDGLNTDYGYGVAVDATGAVYCVGSTTSLGAGNWDLVLVKFSTNSTKIWQTTWGGLNNDYGYGVAVDATGAIYCVGYTTSFGAGGNDLALVKFNANGSTVWSTIWGGVQGKYGYGVAVDATGAIYCVGETASFGAGGHDLALVKFLSDGTKAWNTTWGGSKDDYGYGVAIDATGAIYCVGYTNSFGNGDLVLVKFLSNGTKAWQSTWGGSSTDFGRGVAVDATGAIYCVGYTYSFGGGNSDLALIKFDANGMKTWTKTWGGSNYEYGYGVAVDVTGAIYAVGNTMNYGAGDQDFVLLKFSENTQEKPPRLSNPLVTYQMAYTATSALKILNATVNYRDPDNTPPSYLTVTINSVPYSMQKRDSWDYNYTDGCTYIFTGAYETLDSYSYYFNCSDGRFTASLGPFTGVWKLIPFFDGMYVNYKIQNGGPGGWQAHHEYTYGSNGVFHVNNSMDVNVHNRVLSGISNDCLPYYPELIEGGHTPWWIFPNVSLGDIVPICYSNNDIDFTVIGESNITLPGFHPLECWKLSASSFYNAWYEKGSGILVQGAFHLGDAFGMCVYLRISITGTNLDFLSELNAPNLAETAPKLYRIIPNPDLDGCIEVDWNDVIGAMRYSVYRNTSNITSLVGLQPIVIVSRSAYQDRIANDGTYYYVIVAGDFLGNESSISNCEAVTVRIMPNPPIQLWNLTWGGANGDYMYWNLYRIAVDATGAIYCVGSTGGYRGGSSDILLIKFHPDGTQAWNTTWGTDPYYESGWGVAVDATDAIYCTSSRALIKFNENGTKLWQVNWSGLGAGYYSGVAVDNTGIIYCVGSTNKFGAGGYDLALIRFYPNGTKAWNTTWGGSKDDYGYGVAVDATGAIYCVGNTNSFGGGDWDLSLIKFSANGTKAWSTTWGGPKTDYGRGVAVDATGAIYCIGSTNSFGAGDLNFGLIKFYPNGVKAWESTWGGLGGDLGNDVVVDATGAIYFSGYLKASATYYYKLALIKFYQPIPSLNQPILDPITPNPDLDGLIELNWSDVADAAMYYVYRNTLKITSVRGMVPIAKVTQSSYQDRITSNGTYYYVIIASNLAGNSSMSNCEDIIVLLYNNHSNIAIINDNEFLNEKGVRNPTAAGTRTDPYIISFWEINGGGPDNICITIKNTRKFVEINNCTLFNATIGIQLFNVTNAKITNNNILDNYGINGTKGNGGALGTNGSKAIGIMILNCTQISISNNYISNIIGGAGGIGGGGSAGGNGINGTPGTDNPVFGGNGGNGGNACGTKGTMGGSGGFSSGLYLEDSVNVTTSWNYILNIFGGQGGMGGPGGEGGNGGAGGNGGKGGIGDIVRYGGDGGKGGQANGGLGSRGGIGGGASGIYIKNSINIKILWSTILNISGGRGGAGGFGGNGGKGGAGGTGGLGTWGGDGGSGGFANGADGGMGGMGGYASGVHFDTSNSLENSWNTLSKVIGGQGGAGGKGGNGGIGGNGGEGGYGYGWGGKGGNGGDACGAKGGAGMTGGITTGFYFKDSIAIQNSRNNISEMFKGEGGVGGIHGYGGRGGYRGNGGRSGTYSGVTGLSGWQSHDSNGFNGPSNSAHGFVLKNANYSRSYLNFIYCQDNEDNGLYNRWDNEMIGNYWFAYSGVDNDSNGIGDTPYFIPGTANSQDNFPIYINSTLNENPSGPWNTTWGGSQDDIGRGVAVDATGAIYCVGSTSSFGRGSYDLALVKFYPNGIMAWQTTWGGSKADYGYGVAVDATGAIYCVGYTASFGAGGTDFLLIKFNASGKQEWNTTWGGSKDDYGFGVAVDATGAIICVGYTTSFGAGGTDFLLIKFNASGKQEWNTTWGGSKDDYGFGVAVDATGAIYCVGSTLNFTRTVYYDFILIKFFSNGTKAWNTTWGGSKDDDGYAVAVDATGAIYCVGYTNSLGRGGWDFFLVKFNSEGTKVWQTTWGGSGPDYCYGVAVDASGAIYSVGYTASFGAGSFDLALVKFYPNGIKAWQTTWGGSNTEVGYGVAVDATGAIYCVGGMIDGLGDVTYDLVLTKFYPPITSLNNPILDPISPNPDSDGLIMLNWNDVADASNYYIYRSISNITNERGMVPIATVTQSSYQDRLAGNGTYYYVIVATNLQVNSSFSNCESVVAQFHANWYSPEFGNRYVIAYRSTTSTYWDIHAIYKDLDNDPPAYVKVFVNGTPYLMNKVTPSDLNYTDGCEYRYGINLTRANYIFIFECSDGQYINSTKPFKYRPPMLTGISVNPASGTQFTSFTFTTVYTSLTNYLPWFTRVIINGTQYTMAKQNASDSNYLDGCIFQFSTSLSPGAYLYSFECSDSIYLTSTGSFLLRVCLMPNPPLLNAIAPNPDSDGIILLNWSAVSGANRYYIYRSSSVITSVGGMRPIGKVAGTNYTDFLGTNGNYYYVIVAGNVDRNSSISNCQSVRIAIPTPPVNLFAPSLLPRPVAPLAGTQFTNYTFSVVYQDLDNNPPLSVNVQINRICYAMRQQNLSDCNFKDGALFQYSTRLIPGIYNYSFRCSDGNFYNQPSITYFRLVVYNANVPSITNFTLFTPLTVIHDNSPDILCRISVTGAGINLSSVYYAYSTTGSSNPTNWATVQGVYVDAACTIPAANGATGVLYLKVEAVPFNQYSLLNNTIRFRAADMAGIQIVQSGALTIQIEAESPFNISYLFIIFIIGAVVTSVYSSYVVVQNHRKEQRIQVILKKVIDAPEPLSTNQPATEEYCHNSNDGDAISSPRPVNYPIIQLETSSEALTASNVDLEIKIGTIPASFSFVKLYLIFYYLIRVFPSLNKYYPGAELLYTVMELRTLPEAEVSAYISALLEKVPIIELRTQYCVLMNELNDSEESHDWHPILHKIDNLSHLAESTPDGTLLKDLFLLLLFIKYSSEHPRKSPAQSQTSSRLQTPVEIPQEQLIPPFEPPITPLVDDPPETLSSASPQTPVSLVKANYAKNLPLSELLIQASIGLSELKESTDNIYQAFLYNKMGKLVDMAIVLHDSQLFADILQLITLVKMA